MPSESGWGVWCFPGDRVQVLVGRRNVEGKSQCSVELSRLIIWKVGSRKIQDRASGGEIRMQ